jgi:hypothetical protein
MSGQTPTPQLTLGEIQAVLKKAAQDPAFAKHLQTDPSGAVQSLGYKAPHPDEIAFFAKLGASELAPKATELGTKNPNHTLSEL